jgi:serine protease Do
VSDRTKIKILLLVFLAFLTSFFFQGIIASASTPDVEKVAKTITVRIEGASRGSGIIIERRGKTYTVLTNAHVMQNVGDYAIVAPDGKCYPIEFETIRRLPQIDLAIFLFSSPVSYSVAQLGNSAQLNLGQVVYAGGWANSGANRNVQSRVFLASQGELTEIDSPLDSGYSLTYTNLVRVGMSGGPLLDERGKLIGINGLIRLTDADAIVASGIKIDLFQRWHPQLIKTIPLPAAAVINCPQEYIN